MRLVLAGTPTAAVPTLRALLESPRHEVVAVLTRPPARAGAWPAPGRIARRRAGRRGGRAGTGARSPVRAAVPGPAGRPGRRLLPGRRLRRAAAAGRARRTRLGWINLHFSLLPAWRGAAPVQHAVLHGDEITGASTFLIEAGLDTGPVYGVVTEGIRPTDTAGELLERLAVSGAGLMTATLDGLADGSLVGVPQSSDGISLAPKITVADAEVDWTARPGTWTVLVRACTPAPGAWTTFRGERLKLGPVTLRGGNDLGPGALRLERNAVVVGTASLEVQLGTVQAPGRRPIPAVDWARGARVEGSENLG